MEDRKGCPFKFSGAGVRLDLCDKEMCMLYHDGQCAFMIIALNSTNIKAPKQKTGNA